MIGGIIGDIVGSIYELKSQKPDNFPFFQKGSSFTDDTVLSLAIAKSLLECKKDNNFKNSKVYYLINVLRFSQQYPNAGYGGSFIRWRDSEIHKPYYSYGNGSAMRVAPIGFACNSIDEVLLEAKKSAMITHNHPDGIKGACAVAAATFLAYHNVAKSEIKIYLEEKIGYRIDFSLEELHANYKFEIQCKESVPQAIFAFLESTDFEDAIRKAIYIGGDSDTIACIAGSIAGAYYKKIPKEIISSAYYYLDTEQKKIIKEFNATFNVQIEQ